MTAATTYTYEVSALDAAGHESARSNPATVTTPAPPGAVSYVFGPTDDTYVDASVPSTNFGGATKLVADASPADNLLLRFDVATSGCDITSAKLRLTVGSGRGDGSLKGGDFYATLTTSWSESTVTWANAPAANAALVGSLGAVNPGLTYELDVSSAVGADGPLSLRATSKSMGAVRYVSQEGSATLGPQLVVTCAAPPGAVSYVFGPTDDTYVDASVPSTNFGGATKLVADASPADNLLLRFDVATSGCDITSAKLRLTVGSGRGDGSLKGGDFYATLTTSWSESTVTWANAPAANAALVGSLGAVNPGLTYELDVSSAVGADGPLSLRATSKSMGAVRYVSQEGSATLGPQLVVTCAPA